MGDFKFYLNKQGPKGAQGVKGDQGFSPYISIGTNTANEFTLLVTNEFNSFTTPNLRGSQIEDRGGTYVRYDQDTDAMFAGNPDYASETTYGMVLLADDESISTGASDRVVTADLLQAAISTVTTDIPEVHNGVLTITDGVNVLGTFSANQSSDVTITTPAAITPNDGSLTIQRNGTNVGSFSANSSTSTTVNIQVPTQISDLSDGSTVVTTTALSQVLLDYVKSTTLATVATTGSYNDLEDKPTIPEVNNGTLTIKYGTTSIGTFTANQAGNVEVTIPESTTSIDVDTTLSTTSTNPVQNKVITEALNDKVDSTSLATVATSGDYSDLLNKPTIPETTNFVTLNTDQTITENKTIDSNKSITFKNGSRYSKISPHRLEIGSTSSTYSGYFDFYGSRISFVTPPWIGFDAPNYADNSNPEKRVIAGQNLIAGDGVTITKVQDGTLYNQNCTFSAKVDNSTIGINASGQLECIGGGGGASIDDTTTSTTSVWSSAKVNEAVTNGDLAVIDTVSGSFLMNDSVTGTTGVTVSTTTTSQTTSTSTIVTTQLTAALDTSFVAECAMPSNTTTAVTIGASGAEYIAPANGYYTFTTSNTSAANGWVYLTNISAGIHAFTETSTAGIVAHGFVPAKKGDTVSLGWYGGTVMDQLIFTYAQGSESEAS